MSLGMQDEPSLPPPPLGWFFVLASIPVWVLFAISTVEGLKNLHSIHVYTLRNCRTN